MKLPGGGGMSVKEFVKDLAKEFSRDNLGDAAAAVTYAGVLALFPFLLFLVSLASLFISPEQADQIVQALGRVSPPEVTKIVGDRIRELAQGQSPGLLTLGAVGAIWAASSGVQALMRALNVVYGVGESRPFWKVKAIALGMTLVSGALALAAALAIVAAPAVAGFLGGPAGTAITWLRFPVAGLVMMLLWALLYYVLPDVEQKFKFITPGSVGGVVLWVLASAGFSLYVSNFGKYNATYGSLGGIIVLLLWMWLSSLVLLLGAEANAVIEHRSREGKRAGAKSLAERGPSGAKHEELPPTAPGLPAEEVARSRDGEERPALARGSRAVNGNGHRRLDAPSIVALAAGALLLRRGKPHA